MNKMQHEMEYMKQEVEFIKKLSYWTERHSRRNDSWKA